MFSLLINRALAEAPWARQRLSVFAGRTCRLMAGHTDMLFGITPDGYLSPERPGATSHDALPAGVTLTLPLAALESCLNTLLTADGGKRSSLRETLLKTATVQGNAEFADTLSFLFRHLTWDGTAFLANFIGDIPARRLAMSLAHGGKALVNLTRPHLPNLLATARQMVAQGRSQLDQRLRAFLVPHDEFMAMAEEERLLQDRLSTLETRLSARIPATSASSA
jgi:ubiquinone biosynthesis protein UbiJ